MDGCACFERFGVDTEYRERTVMGRMTVTDVGIYANLVYLHWKLYNIEGCRAIGLCGQVCLVLIQASESGDTMPTLSFNHLHHVMRAKYRKTKTKRPHYIKVRTAGRLRVAMSQQ